MHNIYFYLIIAFYVYDFVSGQLLSYLNRTRMAPVPPEELEGIYDAAEYAKQQTYQMENDRFGLVSGGFSFAVVMALLLCGWAGRIDAFIRMYTSHYLLLPLSFFFALTALSSIMDIPFDWYDTFVIEEKFGFNRMTPRTFILDWLKSFALAVALSGALLTGVLVVYKYAQGWFWLLAWIVVSAFSLIVAFFYSEWIVPIFNRQTPLEEGKLRSAIEDFTQRASYPIQNIYMIDGSRRSTKSNAYFTGFGKKKRIVLYDTLIDDLTTEEIVAVLAHEIGHYKMKHILSTVTISLASTGFIFWLFSHLMNSPSLAHALGGIEPSFHLNMVGFSLLYIPLSDALDLLTNCISRKHEYEADNFAARHGTGDALISALKKICSKSLANLTPHPIVVFACYSHPTLLQRISNIKRQMSM
ncbi:MAG: M48 family metallopeptidase [Synergistaceae bacterium]|jgi:STE24 endopeptidase|nr:M48 family metallopeptidase [Synergistaceae bacterium]